MQLTEKEAKILDKIIEVTLSNECAYIDDLPPIENSYGVFFEKIKVNDYSYFANILKDKGVLEVNPIIGNGFQFKPIAIRTQSFYDQGGFTSELHNQQKEQVKQAEIKTIEEKKLRNEYRLSKWQVRTFWPIFIFGLIGFILSIYNITENRINSKDKERQEETIRYIESELATLRTLILNQKQVDSLSNSNHREPLYHEKN